MRKSYGDGTAKQSKKGKGILAAVLVLLAAALTAEVIHFYPVWNSAGTLSREADFSRFSYELELELDKEELSLEQQKLLERIESLTGCEENAMYQLRIRGSVWEDRIHVLIYPKGMQAPLMELYLSAGEDMVNEAALYNVIRGNLVKKFGLLSYLMPEQTETVYMTLEQTERMFGIDLSGIRSFSLPDVQECSTWQYFAALAFLQGEKLEDGRVFSLNEEQVQIQIAVPGQDEKYPLRLVLAVQDLQALTGELDLSKISWLFPDVGAEMPEELRLLKSVKIALTWGEPQEIVMPKEFISQDTVDVISKIREWIQNYQ